jgi:hypothetical protein
MREPLGRARALWGSALLLTLLLAACTTTSPEELLPADITASTTVLELSADVGDSDTGSFTVSSDVRTRYTTSESASWLAIIGGRKGNLRPGRTKRISVEATCADAGTFSTDITIDPRSGQSEFVTVNLTCEGTDPPPPPPPPPGGGEFEITLVFSGSITNSQKAIFESAAARWAELIVGDVPDSGFSKGAGACGAGEPAFSGTVDDVVIYASVEPIDGPGSILGSAGPCYIRSGSGLPLYGVMRFDSADVGGLGDAFEDVILHEMGHVIGIGTLWNYLNLLSYSGGSCQTSNDPTFTGSGAGSEWQALGGSGNVPVEDSGGSGTKCGHWEETVFDNELMTGYLNGSSANPISRMTVASLADLGYSVDLGAADGYSLPGSGFESQGTRLEFDEEILTPIGVVGPDGSLMSAD